MSVREKLLWAAGAVLLVFLYLASSTDLIIKEREVQIHPVSIILDDVNDAYYQNFKKGVDQAARDYYADTSFTTLYDDISQEQQLQLIRREIEDGAEAVVVVPVNGEQLDQGLAEERSQVPLIVMAPGSLENAVQARICVDGAGAGQMLAEEAAEELPENTSFYLLASDLRSGDAKMVLEGVCRVLDEENAEYELGEWDGETDRLQAFIRTAASGKEPAALIALDKESLTETAQILKNGEDLRSRLAGVYGMGSNTSVLGSLESGIIDGLVTFDQYSAGYLSVEKAVEAIRDSRSGGTVQMDCFYITSENMRDKKYETMLYPME